MDIALQLYSLRQFLKTDEQIVETLNKVKEIGFKNIILSGFGKLTIEKVEFISNLCKRIDIEIIGTHIDFNQLDENFDQMVKIHKRLNVKYIGIGAFPDGYDRSNLNDYQKFIFKANQIASQLNEHGFKLMYHHHAFEYAKIDEFIPMNVIMQNMINPNLSIQADLYWLQFAGVNPLDFIEQYKNKIEVVQIKDMIVKLSSKWQSTALCAPIGKGNMNYKKIISEIKDTNIRYLVVEQDEFYGENPFEELLYSFKKINQFNQTFH